MKLLKSKQLTQKTAWIYRKLYASYGAQHWWPADSPFEVMVGAILTQNTAWTNVEKGIAALKRNDLLDASALLELPLTTLAMHLKPTGYFNVKAKRLQAFCRWFTENGGFVQLAQWDTAMLRHALLSVSGIGPETADDILLYAFNRPLFVVDAYTKRILTRVGVLAGDETYHQIQAIIMANTEAQVAMYNEYHALIVRHAKQHCRTKPDCGLCPLKSKCDYSASFSSSLQICK